MTLRLTGDHDRIAGGLSDLVVRRLTSAGLDLEAARGLTGEHRAADRIQHATICEPWICCLKIPDAS